MHYYKFNIGDYARSTRHLTNDEDLAYRRLLDMYYETESPIPLETQWVARRIRMDVDDVEVLLNDMFIRTEEGWRHPRCDADLEEYHRQAERNRENGKRGGRPKTAIKQPIENPVGSQSDATGEPVVTLTNNHKPITTNHKLDITTKVVCASGDAPALLPEHIVEEWNKTSAKMGKPKVRNLTPERRQNLKARIGQYSIDDFHEVFSKIERSAFLRGETQGWPRGATFDWTFKKANFQKILEGNYDS